MTDNNRPVQRRPQASSRFGELNEPRPASSARPAAQRPAAGSRPAMGGRPATGSRPAMGSRPATGDRPVASRPAPASRPVSGRSGGVNGVGSGKLPKGFALMLGICAGILVLGLLLQGLMPEGFHLTTIKESTERPVAAMVSEIHGEGPIRVNEVMSANGGVLVDASGNTPDWVEVANVGSRPANLKGYVLAKSAKAGNVFEFPDVILQPNECAIIYCDSTLQAELGEELHAPFRLSSSGDVVMLFNDADVAIDTLNLPALGENQAYARRDRNTWEATAKATPGLLNTEDNYLAMTSVVQDGPVKMAEIVASNTQYAPDEGGGFFDYVLLRNNSGDAVDISGWYLSDNPALPRLWKFPSGVVIPAGGTLVVHCSGQNKLDNLQHLHTSFRLSTEGETVTLSNANGQPVDSATYDLLRTDMACIRGADGSWTVGTPTAGGGAPAPAPAADAPAGEAAEDAEPEA